MASFFRNALAILNGTIAGQAIVFLSLPLLSRVYGAAAFGALQALQAVLTVLLIVSSLRYEVAILSADEAEIGGVVRLCIRLCMIMSALTAFGVAGMLLAAPSWLDQLGAAVYLLPVSLLLAGLGQVLAYIGLRTQAFGVIGQAKIAQSLVYVASAIVMSSLRATTFALSAADALGKGALVVATNRGRVRELLRRRDSPDTQIASVAVRFRSLPLFSMPSAIINTLGSSFTPLMMLAIFDAEKAGNFAMVERAIGAPTAIIATAASQAFMSALSNRGDLRGDERALFWQILRANALLALAPFVLLVVAAPALLPWVLGSQWTEAGHFAQIMAPMLYFAFLATPFNMTLLLRARQSWQLAWDALRLLVMGAMWLLVDHQFRDATVAVAAYSVIASLFYLAHVGLSWLALSPQTTHAPPTKTAP